MTQLRCNECTEYFEWGSKEPLFWKNDRPICPDCIDKLTEKDDDDE